MTASTVPYDILALDVDGTLVGTTGEISPRLLAALQEAQARGIGVCLCTGRPLRATQRYLEALGTRIPPVTFNGALVPSPDGGEPLVAAALPWELVQELIAEAQENGDYIELHTAERYYVERLGLAGEYQARKFGYDPIVGPFPDLRDEPILKAQFAARSEAQRTCLVRLSERLAGRAAFDWGVSPGFDGYLVSVLRRGVDKCASLGALLGALGVPWERVLAAGDSPSDLPYVQRAGYGVVMGNAPEAVRRQAPHLAPSVEEEGLSRILERVVLGRG